MHNDTQNWREAVDRVKQYGSARTSKRELELSKVRREFSSLQHDYLELGLRASRLAAERDAALKNLRKTEVYIATLEAGPAAFEVDRRQPPDGQVPARAPLQPEQRAAEQDESHGLRKAVETIKEYVTPPDRLLKNELAVLRRDLSELGDTYLELGGQVNTLSIERDEAIDNLRKAQEFIDSTFPARSGEDRAEVAPSGDMQASSDSLHSIIDTLSRTRSEKNDLEIAAAESKDRVNTLLAEEQRLRDALEMIEPRLAEAEQQRVAAGEQAQLLQEELEKVTSEQVQVRSRDQQQIDVLTQRLADIEPRFEGAQRHIDELTASLEESSHQRESAEQRQQQLIQEREDRINTLLAEEQRLRDALGIIEPRLAEAEQQRVAAGEQAQLLQEELEKVTSEQVQVRSRDQQQIDVLTQRLADIEPRFEGAQRHIDELTASLEESSHQRESAEQRQQQLIQEREDRINTLLAEEQRLRDALGIIEPRLAEAEQQRVAAGEQAQLLQEELEKVTSEQAQVRTHDQQRINKLKQRLAEIVPRFDAARRKIADLTASLEESSHRREFAEQRLQLIDQERDDQRRKEQEKLAVIRERQDVAPDERDSLLMCIETPGNVLVRRGDLPVVADVDVLEQEESRPAWLKIAGGFVVLLLVLVGLTKIHEVGDRIAGKSDDLASLEVEDVRVDSMPAHIPVGGTSVVVDSPLLSAHLNDEVDPGDASSTRTCRQKGLDERACGLLQLNMFAGSVISLPGGVQYSVVRNGTGISPDGMDVVRVNYRGMLLDGSEFDSSSRYGGAVSFRIDEVIPGLQYVLRHMEEGARWQVYVPAELAYRKPALFGGQPVVFDLELISIAGSGSSVQGEAGPQTGGTSVVVASQQNQSIAGVTMEAPLWQQAEDRTQALLRENAGKEGVITLSSGLQYRILESGHGRGRSPLATDTVVLHYRGTLADGSEFDSSYEDSEPVTFSMEEVVPGWYEALLQMEEGAKWQLYIPPELAHSREVTKLGTRGLQPLVYELELVSIN